MKPAGRKLVRFLLIFFLLYFGWTVIYDQFINPWGKLDTLVINVSSSASLWLLELFGYQTFTGPSETIRTIGIDGTHGLWIGDPCNGIALFALFLSFIIAFPGSIKHKLWFAPAGLLAIFLMNVIRIAALCIIVLNHPDWLMFNHTYLFQITMYLFIFALWWLWISRFSKKSTPAA
jgi:exosortase family protein XrtF